MNENTSLAIMNDCENASAAPRSFQAWLDERLGPVGHQAGHVEEGQVHAAPVQEQEHQREIMQIAHAVKRPENGRALHIGAAGFFNFSIAAERSSDYMLLLDSNKNQQVFWQDIVKLLARHDTPEAFVTSFTNRIFYEQGYHYFTPAQGDALMLRARYELDHYFFTMEAEGWLAPEAYAHLHRMAKEGRIAAATIDLVHDGKRAQAVGDALRAAGMTTDSCYWSNIGQFLQPEVRQGTVSHHDSVFEQGDKPLRYLNSGGYYHHGPTWEQRWRGVESRTDKPYFESFLRHTSLIGGATGFHFYANVDGKQPLIVSEGPLRRTAEQWTQRQALLHRQLLGPDVSQAR